MTLQREQDLTSLAPKRRLIPTKPVKRVGWQVGQADKGACEIVEWICRLYGRWGATIGLVVILLRVLFRRVHTVDDPLALSMGLFSFSKLQQMFRLDLEEAALDGGRASQPP